MYEISKGSPIMSPAKLTRLVKIILHFIKNDACSPFCRDCAKLVFLAGPLSITAYTMCITKLSVRGPHISNFSCTNSVVGTICPDNVPSERCYGDDVRAKFVVLGFEGLTMMCMGRVRMRGSDTTGPHPY